MVLNNVSPEIQSSRLCCWNIAWAPSGFLEVLQWFKLSPDMHVLSET
jgi:hypothetical protein